jgi:hypothetical protein
MWDSDPVTMTANEALAAEAGTSDQKSARCEAEEFLRDLLVSGPIPQREVKAAAEGAGVTWATVRRAKERLSVKAHKAGMDGGWLWSLPRRCSNQAEDAHTNNVSTFGKNEHLRANAPPSPAPNSSPNGQAPKAPSDLSDGLDIPDYLDPRPRLGRPALGPPGDDLGDFE